MRPTTPDEIDISRIEPDTLLTAAVHFCRLLRAVGLPLGPDATLEFVRALTTVDIWRRADVLSAGQCMLVLHPSDTLIYRRAFALFWTLLTRGLPTMSANDITPDLARALALDNPDSARSSKRQTAPAPTAEQNRQERTLATDSADPSAAAEQPDAESAPPTVTITYSPTELLRQRDFDTLSTAEIAQARAMLRDQVWTWAEHLSRRRVARRHGLHLRIDRRRLLRRAIRDGGDILKFPTQARKLRRRPLVLLCDISGSMERYTRLLLHFAHALEYSAQHAGTAISGTRSVEVFLFGTRLTRVTRQLRHRNADAALANVAAEVVDWSGGTRIGDCLATFNRQWGRRVLGHGAVVVLVSDGWDRGNAEMLQREMAHLWHSCHRLIWLNPLLGIAGYQPITRGMQAALPFVDDFLPAHNLASLENLGYLLANLPSGRTERRQARVAQRPPHV